MRHVKIKQPDDVKRFRLVAAGLLVITILVAAFWFNRRSQDFPPSNLGREKVELSDAEKAKLDADLVKSYRQIFSNAHVIGLTAPKIYSGGELIELPFISVAEPLFKQLGREIVTDPAAKADLVFEVFASGNPKSADFRDSSGNVSTLYSGADLDGSVVVRSGNLEALSRKFTGSVFAGGHRVVLDERSFKESARSPANAPFLDAFWQSTGFLPTLALLLRDLHGDPAPIVKALVPMLEDHTTCTYAARAIGAVGGPVAAEELLRKFENPEGCYLDGLIEPLGKTGDRRAVEPLIKILKEYRFMASEAAADALGEIGDGRAIEPLLEALEYYPASDPMSVSGGVRFGAMLALQKITNQKFGQDPAPWKQWWEQEKKKGTQ